MRPRTRLAKAGAFGAAVGLLAAGLVAAGSVSPGVPVAQAAITPGVVGYGEMLETPYAGRTHVGAVAASVADAKALGVASTALFWCVDWSKNNVRALNSTSSRTNSSDAAATANYVIQAYQGDKNMHSRITLAVHNLLDPGRNSTKKGQYGYEVKHAKGLFKTRIGQANSMAASAKKWAGPYKLAPAVTLASNKQSISLTDTFVRSAAGNNMASFAGRDLNLTATISGPATFANGSKSMTFKAGAKQTLKVTGQAKVTVSLKSARVLPAASVKQLSYSGKSQDKVLTGGLTAASGAKALTVPPKVVPDVGTTARTLIEGKADGDKQLDYVYSEPAWGEPKWVAPAQVAGSEKLGNLNGLTTTDAEGKSTFDPSKAETVDAGKGIYKDADGNLVNKDGHLVDPGGSVVLAMTPGYFERPGTSKVSAQVDDVVEYGKQKPATDFLGTTGDLRATIRDPKVMEKDAETGKIEAKNVTKAFTGKDYLDFPGKKITGKTGTWNTGVITLNVGERQLTQRFTPADQSGATAADWNAAGVTTDRDDSKVLKHASFVFFEDYRVGGKVLFSHRNPKAASQMFAASNPIMDSVATDAADGDKELGYLGGKVQDKVTASGLSVAELAKKGAKFVLDTGFFDHAVAAENTVVTASQAVQVLDQKENTWSSNLTIPAGYEDRELTMFARLWAVMPDGQKVLVIDHTDKVAASQTFTVGPKPSGHTLAVDAHDGDKYLTETGGPVEETLIYTAGFDTSETYTFHLTGVEPGTCKALPSVKLSKTFKADPAGGRTKFKVDVPGRAKLGANGVAFNEKVTDSKGNVVIDNDNCNNPDETVYLPFIGTRAVNPADGSNVLPSTGGRIDDVVDASNHGKDAYTMTGTVYEKVGEKCVLAKGVGPGVSVYQVAQDGKATSVTVSVTMPANKSGQDKEYVFFENETDSNKRPVASHMDCNSKSQAFTVKGTKPTPPAPPSTPPTPPVETPPAPPLANTGADTGIIIGAGTGVLLLVGGGLALGLSHRRRKEAAQSIDTEL